MDHRDRQIERLETIVEQFGKYLRDSTPPRSRIPWEAIATILAVLGMLVTATQSFAIMGKRIDDLEQQQRTQVGTLDKVPKIDWQLGEILKRLDALTDSEKEQAARVSEIRETLAKVGLRINASK